MNDLKGIIEDCNKSDLVSDKVIKKVIEIIGQEEWQDLHDENNDVCTTMGELIITLKGIADLEKENAELKETLKTYNGCGDWDNDFHTCRVYLQHEELQYYMEQLTKAKELLNRFIETSNPIYFEEDRQKVKAEAEQFLNSEVEKCGQ